MFSHVLSLSFIFFHCCIPFYFLFFSSFSSFFLGCSKSFFFASIASRFPIKATMFAVYLHCVSCAQGMTFCSTLKGCASHRCHCAKSNVQCTSMACGWCVAQTSHVKNHFFGRLGKYSIGHSFFLLSFFSFIFHFRFLFQFLSMFFIFSLVFPFFFIFPLFSFCFHAIACHL